MKGTEQQSRCLFALCLASLAIAIPCLAPLDATFAAADWEGQARGVLRSVVSRAAFRQVLGLGFDLPLTLRACSNQSSKSVTYDTLRSLIREQHISYAGIPKLRQSLCHPYIEQVQVISSEENRFLFSLPAEHCPAIKDLVTRILDDLSGREFEKIFNRSLQLKIIQLFQGTREGFPSTSGFRYWRHVSFAVGQCVSDDDQSILDVTMKRHR